MMMRSGRNRPVATRTVTFPPPTKGWVQSGNIVNATPDQAEVLDNFIVTSQGARLRGGQLPYSTIGESVERLFTYVSGSTEVMFAAGASGIYDTVSGGGFSTGFSSGFSKAPTVARAATSGDWSTVQISTAGGEFLVGVNGTDTGWTYSGSFSDISLTGVASTALSQVWLFKERLFFVEGGTQSAWYLPVESIGGTVTEINLGSVFAKGGNLLFGATWSLDSGSGLDDVCIFVSSQGEIAVYEGTDPSDASTWALVGVYDVAKPLNKHSFFKAGGDLAILTEDGIIPISEALRKDRAALQAVAITYPIEDAWRDAIANRSTSFPISATLWQSKTLLLVGTPAKVDSSIPVSFAANARTGAWSRITGWDVRCAVVFADELYFGSDDGVVYKADAGGTDADTAFTGRYVPKFMDSDKRQGAIAANVVYKAAESANVTMFAHADYQVDTMAGPPPTTSESGDVWGTGVWGTFVWGTSDPVYSFNEWQYVRARGYSLAPGLAITSNQTSKLAFELIETRLRMEKGYAL